MNLFKNRILSGLLCLNFLLSAISVQAEEIRRAIIEHRDGSILYGKLKENFFMIEQDDIELPVPFKPLDRIEFRSDNTCRAFLHNADDIEGRLTLEKVQLETSFGPIELKPSELRSFRFAYFDTEKDLVLHEPISKAGFKHPLGGADWTTDRFGLPNEAIYFDGTNDVIELPEITEARASNLSVSVWVYIAPKQESDFIRSIPRPQSIVNLANDHGPGNGDRGGWGLWYDYVPIASEAFFFRSFIDQGRRQSNVSSAYANPAWHHVVGVWQNGWPYPKIYLNGHASTENEFSNGANKTIHYWPKYRIRLGGYARGTIPAKDHALRGKIDDLRIYKTALSAEQVLMLHGLKN